MIDKDDWLPKVGDRVNVRFSTCGRHLPQEKRITDGEVISIIEHESIDKYLVRFRTPWGKTSGYYTAIQLERSFSK